jgi:lipid-A-disaccharide synthase-like uncharacterized protein
MPGERPTRGSLAPRWPLSELAAMDFNDTWPWIALGLIGQGAFFSRFLVQWVASERAGRSYIPMSFWYLSLVGSMILLVYAIHRQEPIFLLGFLPNLVVYSRNIMLVKRSGEPAESLATAPEPLRPGPDAKQNATSNA